MFEDRDELTHLDFEVQELRVEAKVRDVEAKSSRAAGIKGHNATSMSAVVWLSTCDCNLRSAQCACLCLCVKRSFVLEHEACCVKRATRTR